MKKKSKQITIIFLAISIVVSLVFYNKSVPNDRCTKRDRAINNCVPAGQCGPTREIDAVIDCDIKNYDKKFR